MPTLSGAPPLKTPGKDDDGPPADLDGRARAWQRVRRLLERRRALGDGARPRRAQPAEDEVPDGAPQGQLLLAADARVARAPDQLRDVAVAPGALDAYDDRDASDGEGSDSDSDSDSDDDGAALRAELEKIRAE